MPSITDFLTIIEGGKTLMLFAGLIVVWRMDRRILTIEIELRQILTQYKRDRNVQIDFGD